MDYPSSHKTEYVDKLLLENEKIIFNAGDRRFSVAMKAKDYQELVHPQVVDIALT